MYDKTVFNQTVFTLVNKVVIKFNYTNLKLKCISFTSTFHIHAPADQNQASGYFIYYKIDVLTY